MAAKLRGAYELVVISGPAIDYGEGSLPALAAESDALVAAVAEQPSGRDGRELRSALGALPTAALGTVVLSRGAEEDAPFAAQAVAQLEDAVVATRTLIACELLGAVRVVRRRGVADRLTGTLAEVFVRASASLGSDDADRDLRPDLERATALVTEIADLVAGR